MYMMLWCVKMWMSLGVILEHYKAVSPNWKILMQNGSMRTGTYAVLNLPYDRDWSPKFATGLNMIIGCSSKSIWVIKLSFRQNDSLMGESFWQNNSLVTHILFELQPIIIFSPVANFGYHSLVLEMIFSICMHCTALKSTLVKKSPFWNSKT